MSRRAVITTDGYDFDLETIKDIGLYYSIDDNKFTIIDTNNDNKIIYTGEIKYCENRDY